MENFETCTVAMLGGPCSQHVTGNTSRQNQPQSAIISYKHFYVHVYHYYQISWIPVRYRLNDVWITLIRFIDYIAIYLCLQAEYGFRNIFWKLRCTAYIGIFDHKTQQKESCTQISRNVLYVSFVIVILRTGMHISNSHTTISRCIVKHFRLNSDDILWFNSMSKRFTKSVY